MFIIIYRTNFKYFFKLTDGLAGNRNLFKFLFNIFRKNILHDASRHGDFTADKFQEIQRRIESNLQNVNPAEEYREFTEKHK